MNLIKYLLHRPTWQKLPPMPRQYSTEYNEKAIDRDTATLMQLTHVRSPHNVKLLQQKHAAADAHALITLLPRRRRPRHLGKRFLALIQRAFGMTNYDPMKEIARKHIKRGRRY